MECIYLLAYLNKICFVCKTQIHHRWTFTDITFLNVIKVVCVNKWLTRIFIGIIYFCAGRTNPMIILNQNVYKLHTRYYGCTYWRCVSNKTHCKARLVTRGNLVTMNTELHNHPPGNRSCVGLPSQHVQIAIKNGLRIPKFQIWGVISSENWYQFFLPFDNDDIIMI